MTITLPLPVTAEERLSSLAKLRSDRPIYDCTQCGERTVQYFCLLAETSQTPERVDSFVCFSCGRAWQI